MKEIEHSYVALIDIMGFGSFVENNSHNDVLQYLKSFISISQTILLPSLNVNVSIFSDTVAVSSPIINDATKGLMGYYNFLAYVNSLLMLNITEPSLGLMPLRGAITKGEFYNREGILFGKAWVEAYKLETEKAKYPRVITQVQDVTPEGAKNSSVLINSLLDKAGFEKINNLGIKPFDERTAPLRRDSDGELHCNYFSSLWLYDKGWSSNTVYTIIEHGKFIIKHLIDTRDNKRVHVKYKWMKDYHNWFCEGYNEFEKYVITGE